MLMFAKISCPPGKRRAWRYQQVLGTTQCVKSHTSIASVSKHRIPLSESFTHVPQIVRDNSYVFVRDSGTSVDGFVYEVLCCATGLVCVRSEKVPATDMHDQRERVRLFACMCGDVFAEYMLAHNLRRQQPFRILPIPSRSSANPRGSVALFLHESCQRMFGGIPVSHELKIVSFFRATGIGAAYLPEAVA
jgi:hypothetical protein